MPRILFSLLLILVVALAAFADSDGYFCVGPNYLAMEFRSFNTPDLAGPHVLKILHFDEGRPPRWSGQVIVEDFQTHTLTCYPTGVLFEGAGNPGRGWLSYTVILDLAGAPSIASKTSDPAHALLPANPLPNLGNWARSGIIPLSLERLSHQFQLHVTERSSREGREIRHDKRTVLEEIDDSGRVIRSLPISQGTLYESIGG